ncbi:MAG: hypothetical protein R2876_06590 [Eubacteriales bacterium]
MKKKIALIMGLMLIFAVLSACSENNESTDASQTAGFSKEDLAVTVNGADYKLRVDSAPILAALGDGYEYMEVISCVYDGKDKTFTYPGIIVNTVPVEGKDVVEMFTLTDSTYSTSKGIKVGDTKDDIISVYGEDYFDDGYMTYSTTNDETDIEAERIQFLMGAADEIEEIYVYSPSY